MKKIRISVANIVPCISVSGEQRFFGIVNKGALKRGINRITSLGGAANLTRSGFSLLQERFGADNFEGNDARFQVDEEHKEAVLELFEKREPLLFEIDPIKEMRHELFETAYPPILDVPPFKRNDLGKLVVHFSKTLRQVRSDGRSTREIEDIQTSRLFHLFSWSVSPEVSALIKKSPVIKMISNRQLTRVMLGQPVKTPDGFTVGDNIIW